MGSPYEGQHIAVVTPSFWKNPGVAYPPGPEEISGYTQYEVMIEHTCPWRVNLD